MGSTFPGCDITAVSQPPFVQSHDVHDCTQDRECAYFLICLNWAGSIYPFAPHKHLYQGFRIRILI